MEGRQIVKLFKSAIAAIVCAGLLVPSLPLASAHAAPLGKINITKASPVDLVHRRGWGVGALIGGIVGGALIAAAIREGRAEEADLRACERDYRSFDRRTGTYINRYGEERICPYLR